MRLKHIAKIICAKIICASALIMVFGAGLAVAQGRTIASPTPGAAPVGDQTPSERIGALELRLLQMEQTMQAQKVLQARKQMTDLVALRQRIEKLEAQLADVVAQGGASPAQTGALTDRAVGVAPRLGRAATGSADIAPENDLDRAKLQTRYNDMAESLRTLHGQTDQLILQMRDLQQIVKRSGADNEFRFQALESGVRRATAGISSTSEEPEVIGVIKRAAPVAALGDASPVVSDTETPLVGEGDLSALENFGQPQRRALSDPKALYERGLKDLQLGNYAGAEMDFVRLLATHPAHSLAGNAQYWLGETYYVRRQFKQAAEAFLAGYTTYAQNRKAPDSLLKLGMTLTALGEKQTGCDAFAELGAKFPDAPEAITKRAEIERRRADCGS